MTGFRRMVVIGVLSACAAGGGLPDTSGAPLLLRAAWCQEAPQTLTVGGIQVFTLRVGDTLNGRKMTVQDRINNAQDVFAKHLGATAGKFTTKVVGPRVHLYLNGDFILAVTPEDAKATGYKDKETPKLAESWVKKLRDAFKKSHA